MTNSYHEPLPNTNKTANYAPKKTYKLKAFRKEGIIIKIVKQKLQMK